MTIRFDVEQETPVKKQNIDYRKPPYALESVNNALRALHLLRDSGSVRITDLSDRLGVARSTAHRTMAMLVYQGFAVQDDHQRYLAGPALSAPVIASRITQNLERVARPVLERLRTEIGETVNLSMRIGVHTRVLATTGNGDPELDLGDRSGHVYPAHATAAGRALLAVESPKLLERLYRSKNAELIGSLLGDADYAELLAQLSATRLHGYALCDEEVQRNISSVAVGVFPGEGQQSCAIVLLTSAGRLAPLVADARKVAALFAARDELQHELQEHPQDLEQ